jgi:addiction module HigA family antidote
MANNDRLPPIHPGEILREEFLSPLGMSAHQLALALRVPATRFNDIVNEKRGITADTPCVCHATSARRPGSG